MPESQHQKFRPKQFRYSRSPIHCQKFDINYEKYSNCKLIRRYCEVISIQTNNNIGNEMKKPFLNLSCEDFWIRKLGKGAEELEGGLMKYTIKQLRKQQKNLIF